MTYIEITTKERFYSMWKHGLLGNRPRIGNELRGFHGPVMFRSLEIAGKYTIQTIDGTLNEYPDTANEVLDHQLERVRFQAEVTRCPELWCRHTTVPDFFRPAMATRSTHTRGLAAKLLLERQLDPVDLRTLMDLLDLYPSHVVELGVYEKCFGIHNRRCAFWEVRRY